MRRILDAFAGRPHIFNLGHGILQDTPLAHVQEMLAQVREPLLSVLRTSPDFRPAYDPLVAMAALCRTSESTKGAFMTGSAASGMPTRQP